jgi:hypothetical protein
MFLPVSRVSSGVPPTTNKANIDKVLYILSFQNCCCVDCDIIYSSYDTQKDT